MPEQDNEPQAPQGQQAEGTTLRVRGHELKTSYANICLLFSTKEEMILDFGIAFPSGNREKREADMIVSDRIIMGLPATKRLAIALSQSIQRYENTFGVIPLEQRARPENPPSR